MTLGEEILEARSILRRLEGWITTWQHRMSCGGSADEVPDYSRRMVEALLVRAKPFLGDCPGMTVALSAFQATAPIRVADAVEVLSDLATTLRAQF
ncbi:hypothetical protein [Microbispora sp. NPDC049125]|uniref:hypothetical protein n=1 Tax=Microbispora sp. NPDC049125 TaxID=3154929 RepID=UPI00346597C9